MILPCLSWIGCVCEEFSRLFIPEKPAPCLPDHIIVDILSRLPAEHVLECRLVCKLWKALTSTTKFIDLHLKRSPPTMIYQFTLFCPDRNYSYTVEQNELCPVEEWIKGSSENTKPEFKKFPFASFNIPVGPGSESFNVLQFSLVFTPGYSGEQTCLTVFNPITQSMLTLADEGTICGIFCHPGTGEYMVLCFDQPDYNRMFSYKMCNLKPQSSWRHVADLPYRPRLSTSVISNESLHWIVDQNINAEEIQEPFYTRLSGTPHCSESILVFNTATETFSVMPHPGVSCDSLSSAYIRSTAGFAPIDDYWEMGALVASGTRHHHMELVEIQGQLALSDFDMAEQIMELWLVEDHANWIWKKGYEFNLQMEVEREPFNQREKVIPMGVLDGELFINWKGRGFFGCRLQQQQQQASKRYQWQRKDGYDLDQGASESRMGV